MLTSEERRTSDLLTIYLMHKGKSETIPLREIFKNYSVGMVFCVRDKDGTIKTDTLLLPLYDCLYNVSFTVKNFTDEDCERYSEMYLESMEKILDGDDII